MTETYEIKTRDDVILNSILYHQPLQLMQENPTIFIRTPYGTDRFAKFAQHIIDTYYNNFVVLVQDARGFHESSGNFSYYRHCGNDAGDSIEWIIDQDWSNGDVYSVGGSANGITQYMMVISDPHVNNIAGQCISVASPTLHKTFNGGAFREQLWKIWLSVVGYPNLSKDIITHEAYNDFWKPVDIRDHIMNIKWPSIHIGGWFDIFSDGTIDGYSYYKSVRENDTYLIMNVGGHCYKNSAGIIFNDGQKFISIDEKCVNFFMGEKPFEKFINVYVMNLGKNGTTVNVNDMIGNYWIDFNTWPEKKDLKYFFQIDGKLDMIPMKEDVQMSYEYDPHDVVKTIGGKNLYLPCGPAIMNEQEKRSDTLVFTSSALKHDIAMIGEIIVHLQVSSNVTDTDFVCRMSDVFPNGQSILISDGIIRMKWRDDESKISLMKPHEKYDIDISLLSTALVISNGHKIRIACTSSNHPRFSINGNSGKLAKDERESDWVIAKNSIYIQNSYVQIPSVDIKFITSNKMK